MKIWLVVAGQTVTFSDACCVQQAQNGYLEEREQWFFILPAQLRFAALQKRGTSNFSKIWGEITRLNYQFGLLNHGRLEQLLPRQRAFLTQYQSRIELLTD